MTKLRSTPQRQLILSLMQGNYTHPTADEICDLARRTDRHISRGTVYRNLNLLADSGAIRRLGMPEGPDHYDCRTDNHYHFYCRGCGKVLDTALSYQRFLNGVPAGLPGYRTEWHRIILVGLCPECQKAEQQASNE